tara:strand:+ start:623 stop:1531 length:909 start_codon:yes stop_codon:yes gene_type:complete
MDELLTSILAQDYRGVFEVCVIEDGSVLKSNDILDKFKKELTIQYFDTENTGPGASRNFGMKQAKGNYFIILDSDVILPKNYLSLVDKQLELNFTDAFGGPDAAHPNFTPLQKAINYSMTSFLTTGGIRGKKKGVGTFQPRSFNMGLSKIAFEKTKGFSDMRAGEDIDLTFRLWEEGFKTQLIEEAFVYHKRRNSIAGFFKQTFAFGTARPILNKKYPQSAKLTYWFPSLFIIGFDLSILLLIFGYWQLAILYVAYFVFVYADSTVKNRDFKVGFLSIFTSLTQFIGYGLGFLESQLFKNKK